MIKVSCCGGRDFTDHALVDARLSLLAKTIGVFAVVHGGARGADTLCALWAASKGYPVIEVAANWGFYQKSAGHKRNTWMLELCAPTYAVAFAGGAGTANMASLIQQKPHITLWDLRE